MAAASSLESFSIREYTAKMRRVDFGKCWPFDGDGDGDEKRKGEMRRSLPPISIGKFRWWSDELEAERSAGEKPDGAARGLQLEKAGALAEEGMQTRTPVTAKQRAPKKRSAVELFAGSIQTGAETVGGDGEEGEEEAVENGERETEVGGEEVGRLESLGGGVGGGSGADGKVSSPRKREERVKQIEKEKKMRKKFWMKHRSKMKKESKVHTCAAKKERNYRPETSYSGDISRLLQDSVSKKRLRKAVRDAVDARKKKTSTVKSLLKKQNCKLIQYSKLLFKSQEEIAKVLPVHGILKNQTKASSITKINVTGDMQSGSSLKPSRVSEKHVTFSGKDEILGHNNNFSPMELSQLQSLCKIFSDVLAASSARDDLSKGDEFSSPIKGSQVVNESEKDAATSGGEGTAGCEKTQFSDAHSYVAPHEFINPNNGTCSDREISSLGEALDLNNIIEGFSNSSCSHTGSSVFSASHLHSGNQQVLNSDGKEGSSSGEGIRPDESIFRISDSIRSLSTPIQSGSEAMSSPTKTGNLISQPLTVCSAMSMKAKEMQPHLSLGLRIDVDRCVSETQPTCFSTPKDLRSSICTSVGLKKSGETGIASDQVSICSNKWIDENFIGLPLNSQGELIKLHYSGKFGRRDLFVEKNTALGSCRSFPVSNLAESRSNMDHVNMRGKPPAASYYMKDQSRWHLEQYNHPANVPVTSGLGVMQLHGFESMGAQNHVSMRDKDQHVHHGPNSKRVSCNGCREYGHQAHSRNNRQKFQAEGNLDHGIQSANQTTMRLMGTNVTVGTSCEKCSFDDGKIWTDKEIITEHSPSVRLSETSLPNHWPQQGWFKHPVFETSRFIQPLKASSSTNLSPSVGLRSDHVNFDCPDQWILRNGLPSTMGNYGSRMNPSSHLPPSQTMQNKTPNPAVISVTEYNKVGHQIPFIATNPQNIQHMPLMSPRFKHRQSFSFSTSSTSHPAFLSQSCGTFLESSSAQSLLCLPQCLPNAKPHKRSNKSSFPFCSDPIVFHHLHTTSGNKLPLLPSMHPAAIITSPVYNTSSSHTCGSTPLVLSSFVQAYPASKSTFPDDANFRNRIKDKYGKKSKLPCLKVLDQSNKSNKRPAAKDDGFMRPAKKPQLTIQGNSVPRGPRREQLNDCSSDVGTEEILALANKIINIGLPILSNEKNGLAISSDSSSLNSSGRISSGPVKLSAGAKHILKPSQNMDQHNPRPIHSTISFAVGTSSSTAAVSQKSAMIYRF